jgi:hypothetical protein
VLCGFKGREGEREKEQGREREGDGENIILLPHSALFIKRGFFFSPLDWKLLSSH